MYNIIKSNKLFKRLGKGYIYEICKRSSNGIKNTR